MRGLHPRKLSRILARYGDHPEALREAGIAYAIDQISDLVAAGVDGIHLYTMNKPCGGQADQRQRLRHPAGVSAMPIALGGSWTWTRCSATWGPRPARPGRNCGPWRRSAGGPYAAARPRWGLEGL